MQLHQSDNKTKNILLLLGLGTICLNILAMVLMLFNNSMLQQLNQQLMPQVLVELMDGRAITAAPEANLDRQATTIRRFVGETMIFMFTSSSQQPPATILQVSSDLIASEFQSKFEKEFFHSTPDNSLEKVNRDLEKVLVIQTISHPEKITEGKWKVEIFANQLIFSNADKLGKSVSFNKQVLVRAVEQPTTILPNNPLSWDLVVYRLGEARLQIYNICEINNNNCS